MAERNSGTRDSTRAKTTKGRRPSMGELMEKILSRERYETDLGNARTIRRALIHTRQSSMCSTPTCSYTIHHVSIVLRNMMSFSQ